MNQLSLAASHARRTKSGLIIVITQCFYHPDRRAQELFESDSLPQKKQLLNLYLNRVNVYPEYVQIHLHRVPVNIIRPTSGKDELPAVNDSEADLHILLKTAKIKPLPHLKRGGTGENVVERIDPNTNILFLANGFAVTVRF